MKLSKIALATAATCGALASTSVFAIPASSYTNSNETTGDTLNIRISGASAQDNGILGSALSLCVAGTVTKYSISNNAVYYCTPDVGSGPGQITVPSGKTKLAIYKYSVGGSGGGVGPINSNTAADGSALTGAGNQLPFLDLAKIAAVGAGTTTVGATFGGGLSTYTNVALSNGSGAVTTLATTYIGLSDVEPAFFSSNIGNITAAQSYALIFGVPVSINVRNALQTQQGLVSGSDTEANMPSLTSAQVTSAFTQSGQTWAGIGVTVAGLANDTIHVARRVDSSGTQKTFEALVARTPNGEPYKSCQTDVDPFVAPDSSNTTTGDPAGDCVASNVFAGSGGGDVRNCLIAHNGANQGAIGILTTEDKAPLTGNTWRFVKVDGVTPSQAQVAAGKYRHYVESTLNTRTSGTYATSTALGYGPFVTRLLADFANPTIINQINGAAQTWGSQAGLMALISRTGTTPDYTGSTPVVPWTKLVSGSTLNNCQSPKAVF